MITFLFIFCQLPTLSKSTYLAVSRGNSFLLGDHFKFCMRVYLFLTLLANWFVISTINAVYHEVCMHHFSPYSRFMESGIAKFPAVYKVTSASKRSIRRFVITEKAPTRAFSWLKAATTTFTFKTLSRHYDKRALTPRSLIVKLGPRRKGHKGRAVWLA